MAALRDLRHIARLGVTQGRFEKRPCRRLIAKCAGGFTT
jgi:hypothetical protein